MLVNISDARELTRLAGVPMYRGRNSAYVSFTLFHVDKWLTFAEKSIVKAVAAKFGSP
jgi:hypothetical protein